MKTYEVTIKATIIKTYTIEAESEAEAVATGNDIFSVEPDEAPERYEQEMINVCEQFATDESRSFGPHYA
jgi:hypothetical protein